MKKNDKIVFFDFLVHQEVGMIKIIKSYMEYGENCGIAKQVQGQSVDAEKDKYGMWHFMFSGEQWVASDYAFKE